MTAEVAILNHNAVALAADSAASTVNESGQVSKVYNTLTKIHSPILTEPIAAMFYGTAHFAGIPWDTVFKFYRTKSPRNRATLAEYATDFLNWLHNLAESKNLLESLQRRQMSDVPLSTGLVFAGFGTDQLLPAICQNTVIVSPTEQSITIPAEAEFSAQIAHPLDTIVLPFAQVRPMLSFITGFDAEYYAIIQNFIQEQITSALTRDSVVAVDTPENIATAILNRLHITTQEYMNARSQAIRVTVASFPKEELAIAAESLVNMTSLWQQITPESATVGGPIDIAVISKGDGLVWIKRKHYFKPELNLRYLERNRRRERYDNSPG